MLNNSSYQPEDYLDVVTIRTGYSQDWQVVLAVNSILIAIASPILNLLIVCAIFRTKELRTPTNTFIVSMAFGEILFSLFSLPFTAASLLENSWPFSISICKGSAFLQTLGRTISSYCLLLVCFDRYIAISRPLKYTNIITQKFSLVCVFIVWCLALLFCVILLVAWDLYNYAEILFMCTAEIAIRHAQGALVKEMISSYLPIFLILTYLLVVLKEVKSHNRIFAMVPVPATTNNTTNPLAGRGSIVGDILPLSRAIGGFNRNTRRALRSFFIMALSFVVLCSPISIAGIVLPAKVTLTSSSSSPTTLVPMWLSILYCVVNPVIIIFFNRKFQSQLKQILLLTFCCRKNGSIKKSQEVFTISTGLQSVLDTTLIKTLAGHGGKISITQSLRRRGISV